MALELVTAPANELISTADAKSWLKVDVADDDALIDNLVKAARQHAELATRRALITQTWDLKLDDFPTSSKAVIHVPLPPLQSIASITYVDSNGDTQTWDTSKYDVDTPKGDYAQHGRVVTAFGEDWPSTRDQINAVTIKFKAGYGDNAAAVPQGIIQAAQLILGHWYEHRESVIVGAVAVEVPMTANAILAGYRALRFQA